jgi:hypothetical protein
VMSQVLLMSLLDLNKAVGVEYGVDLSVAEILKMRKG